MNTDRFKDTFFMKVSLNLIKEHYYNGNIITLILFPFLFISHVASITT